MNCVVARYGEVGLKSRWVRRQFEKKLAQNISIHLKKHKIGGAKVKMIDARIYIYANKTKKILKLLADVPGVVSYSPVQVTENDIEKIKETALEIYKSLADDSKKSFRITASRSNKGFSHNSQQIAEQVGGYVVKNTGTKAKMKDYDININIEVRDKAYLFSGSSRGIGGLPIGSQERVICLFSDIKSAVSAVELIRRGCKATLLYMAESRKELSAVKKLHRYISDRFYSCEEPLNLVVLDADKDCYVAAAELAKKVRAKAIVSGSGLSSINELKTVAKRVDMPILLPVVGMDDNEITVSAKRFGLKR